MAEMPTKAVIGFAINRMSGFFKWGNSDSKGEFSNIDPPRSGNDLRHIQKKKWFAINSSAQNRTGDIHHKVLEDMHRNR